MPERAPAVASTLLRIPLVGRRLARTYLALRGNHTGQMVFEGSAMYWEHRYSAGGDSGAGSYGKHARFKAKVLNQLVSELDVRSVIEFGCGDGNQLALASYPHYLGIDVSERAVEICRERFADDVTKSFTTLSEYSGQHADLALSLDVIYHLVENEAFTAHMQALFVSAERFVVLYSSNTDGAGAEKAHVRHRRFTDWVEANATGWTLSRLIRNAVDSSPSAADFYVYEREPTRPSAP